MLLSDVYPSFFAKYLSVKSGAFFMFVVSPSSLVLYCGGDNFCGLKDMLTKNRSRLRKKLKSGRCRIALTLVVCFLLLADLAFAHDARPKKIVFAIPEGYPNFTDSAFFKGLSQRFNKVGLELDPVEYPSVRAFQFLLDGKVDMIAGRRNTLTESSPALIRVPNPLLELHVHLYMVEENAELTHKQLCEDYWGLSPDQPGLITLIEAYLGCEKPARIVWKSNLQERIQMLKARRFVLMPAPTSYEYLLTLRGVPVYRLEPAILHDFLYAYVHESHAEQAALINKALAD